VRIGVAACDPAGTLAYPLTTLAGGTRGLQAVVALVAEYQPVEVIVGLPRSLSGGEGPAAAAMRARAVSVARALPAGPGVRLVDERLTTVTASRRLSAAGKRMRQQRALIDAAAAVTILEIALDAERGNGVPPGELVVTD
jgi:putative Holliday junction resolvase